MGKVIVFFVLIIFLCGCSSVELQMGEKVEALGNKPERVEWFEDQGLGMFIHWGVDSQLGSVISHSMVGASDDYLDRYINELPGGFSPDKFEPDKWAQLAKLAGFKYVVFTTKHHSGFCMFDTKTTEFNITNTPYGKDITKEIVDAFRRAGIGIGFYFSPDDFWFIHKQGYDVSRKRAEADPINNAELMAHNKAQLRELLSNYGAIDVLFLDGVADELKELAWQLQPNIVVTRGEMETPEQVLRVVLVLARTPGPLRGSFAEFYRSSKFPEYCPEVYSHSPHSNVQQENSQPDVNQQLC